MLDAGAKLAIWEILGRTVALICSTGARIDTKLIALQDRKSGLGRPANKWYPRLGTSLEVLTRTSCRSGPLIRTYHGTER